MSRGDRDLRLAIVPKLQKFVFPRQCVCCMDPNVTVRQVNTACQLHFDLGLEGTARRTLETVLAFNFADVPYCARHSAEFDNRLVLSGTEHRAEGEKRWLKALAVIGPAAVLGVAGGWLFGVWGFLIGSVAAIFAISIPILAAWEKRRTRELSGGAEDALPGRKEAAMFGSGADGLGGTLGFQVHPQATAEKPAIGDPVVHTEGIILEFQIAEYAVLFRATNAVLSPNEAKEEKREDKKREREMDARVRAKVRAGHVSLAADRDNSDIPDLIGQLSIGDVATTSTALDALNRKSNWAEHNAAVVSALLPLINHSDQDIRARCLTMLVQREPGQPQILPALVEAAHDPYEVMRRKAANTLGRYPSVKSVNALNQLLHDKDAEARSNAHRSLQALAKKT